MTVSPERSANLQNTPKIIHIDADSASISKNIVVDIPIVADAKLAIEKLLEYVSPSKAEEMARAGDRVEESQSDQHGQNTEGLTPEKVDPLYQWKILNIRSLQQT